MKGKRIVSLLLCLVLTLGLLPMSVFAAFLTPVACTVDKSYKDRIYTLTVAAHSATTENKMSQAATISGTYWKCPATRKLSEGTIASTQIGSSNTSRVFLFGGTTAGTDDHKYGYPVTITVQPAEGCTYKDVKFYKGSNTASALSDYTVFTPSETPIVKTENGITTITFAPMEADGVESKGKVYVQLLFDGAPVMERTIKLYPRPDITTPIELKIKDGEPFPDLEAEAKKDYPDYFYTASIAGWYTSPMTKNAQGTYTADENAKFTAPETVNGNLTLYAKPEIKADAKIRLLARLPLRQKLTEYGQTVRLINYAYTPAKTAVEIKNENAGSQYWTVPIIGAIGDTIPQEGTYDALLSSKENVKALIPAGGAEVTFWRYLVGGEWKELTSSTQFASTEAEAFALLEDLELINLWPDVTFKNQISFDSQIFGLTFDNQEIVTTETKGGTGGVKLSTEAASAIAQKISEQEQKEGFTKKFRGWYLNSACTGKAVDLSKYGFNSDATLYAKWVDSCKVTFNFGKVAPTNADQFAERTVGKGDLLAEPVRPLAGNMAFDGWFKDADCTQAWKFEDTYKRDEYGNLWLDDNGDPIVEVPGDRVSGDMTLYAKFTGATPITINFYYANPDEPSNMILKQTLMDVPVADGYPYGTLPVLPGTAETKDVLINDYWQTVTIYSTVGTKRTYTYTGWEFTDKGNQKQTLLPTTVLASYLAEGQTELNVYAKHDTTFQIKFDLAGGSTTNEDEVRTVTINAESGTVQKPTVEPTKEGKDFGGWVNAATNEPFNFDASYSENTTIKANWVAEKEYTVQFELEPEDAQLTVKKNGSETAATPDASSSGSRVVYKLTKGVYTWTVSKEGYKTISQQLTVGNDYNQDNIIKVTLSAFQSVTGITLDLPENQIMQKKSYDLSALATVSPEKASYKTIVWSVTGNEGVTLGEDGKTLTVSEAATGTVTLTATIANGKLSEDGTTEETYTQTFALTIIPYQPTISFNAGTGPAEKDITGMPAPILAVDGKISAPTAPTASGWTFEGWYLDTACESAWTAKHEFTADTTLYAKWTKNPVAVTITFAGGEGAVLNTGAIGEHKGMSGDKITLPACMYTKPGYIFRSWDGTYAGTEYTLPEEAKTFTAQWTQITSSMEKDDIQAALKGITADNAKDDKPQLLAARDALAAGTATKTDAALIGELSALFKSADLGSVTISGDASQNAAETGAILSSDGAAVVLNINKQATAGKALPTAYQNEEYKSAWRTISMTVGGATTDPKVPVILSLPIPTELSGMAADTIRVLAYKGAATEPVVLTPTVSDGKLTFGFDGNGTFAFVGKEISDAADTRVTALVMKYNGTKMGNVEQDASGNFTVTLPSTTSESILQDLSSGINSKWLTYLTVAPQAKVKPSDGADQTAEYWANTGLALTYSLSSSNSYSQTRSFTVTAANGTTRSFTVTVKKITDADRNYKIAVSNINGGTVTATPSPAAAGEEVKLTVTPNDGKKLVAGSLSYCLQSAGAKSVPIDEGSLTFIMPAGDININAQFEDDANAPLKNPPQITAFVVNGVSAVINSDTKAITIILPYGTDLKHVAPTIVTANASKVEPSSAQRVDLSTPKAYRVYASNGAYVTYTVTAYTEEPSLTQSLWEKLQNQINSNPNWWELAEYQKKNGYY